MEKAITKRMYAIEKSNGSWWTGTCWGVEQAREEYAEIDDLPTWIGEEDSELSLTVFATPDHGGYLDARYYDDDTYDDDNNDGAIASVRRV